MIWNWIKRRYTKRMEEDDVKIETKVAWLNHNYKPAKWDSVSGFVSMTSITIKEPNKLDFDLNKGIPLKAFYNSETGEIKTFFAADFLKTPVRDGTIS